MPSSPLQKSAPLNVPQALAQALDLHKQGKLAEAFGQDVGKGRILIRQKVSQSDVAAMAGIARENVSRILNDWMRAKLVSRLAGYYCLENRAALESEAEM